MYAQVHRVTLGKKVRPDAQANLVRMERLVGFRTANDRSTKFIDDFSLERRAMAVGVLTARLRERLPAIKLNYMLTGIFVTGCFLAF
jgi:hypothetical protein